MDDEDFGFSDHDLDDLPPHALQHLEAKAARATQRPTYRAPSSDYGLDDGDEVVNLDDHQPSHAHAYAGTEHVPALDEAEDGDTRNVRLQGHPGALEQQPPRSQADPDQLLQRIKKLEQEKARERRDVQNLQSKLQTKAGEADTLRRRHDAESRRLERQMADQYHAHTTELARLRADMDKLRREKESAQTDNMFNQHEAREADMARRAARPMPSRPKAAAPVVPSPAGTPKRAQRSTRPLGDGFDDDSFLLASPSRTRDRHTSATPRQATKRKRTVTDQSPIPLPALQLSESPRTNGLKAAGPAAHVSKYVALLHHFQQEDGRFDLLHRLLAYPSSNGTDRILEALTQYAFPSQPSKRLSSLVYDALAIAASSHVHDLAISICSIFCDTWKRCQNERYYAPTSVILDALHFVLAYEPVDTAVHVGHRLVPLIIAFADLVSDPISKAAKGGAKAIASLHSAAQRDVASHINVSDCLELLHILAASCVSSSDSAAIVRFWRAIPSTFACMLLVKEQPREHIILMLRILSTSSLPDSLGPICNDESSLDSQASNEDALINRLTNLFTETPRPIPDPSSTMLPSMGASEADVWDMRLLVVSTLAQCCIYQQGVSRLAQNRLCTGRLVKYLDYCVKSLYHQPLSPCQDRIIRSINATMRLIYHIATSNSDFDIKSKLVNTLGGQHAYLVSLTRLAFSEGLLLEYGIEDEVVNMAHDILDQGLSLEEGDAFGKVFSSGSTTT
ncbi:hypothetical protein ACN47E_009733 [Coniothyrium glycines]